MTWTHQTPSATSRSPWARRAVLGALATVAALAVLGPGTACAQHPYQESAQVAPISSQVSVTLEQPGGGALPAYWEGDSLWVEGRVGQAYAIRVHNHSPRRVEAVVTVDGRDVLTGREGNYAKHRGYVIQPYGSVVVDGFRQSLDQVATFRFTEQHDAYSSRMGTPQNVGVIGVAVFEEKQPRRRTTRPVQPRPYYEDDRRPASDPTPQPWGGRGDRARGNVSESSKQAPRSAAPPAEAESAPADSRRHGAVDYDDYGGYGGSYAPRPRRDERLGTQYGETRYSSVREVTFKRKRSRRPDALLTVYYDSREGLRSRGILPEPPVVSPYPPYEPEPWPSAGFAPPPPRRY